MPVNVKIPTKRAQRAIKDLDDVMRRAANATLRDAAKYTKKEGAKIVLKTRYSNTPLKEIQKRILTRTNGTSRTKVSKQSSQVGFRGGDIPAHFMDVANVQVGTRRGKRWGVTLRGKLLKGVFHLISIGHKQLIQAHGNRFTKHSKLFVRAFDDSLEQYKFKTMSEVITDAGEVTPLYMKGRERIDKQIKRNMERYMYLWTKQRNG